ncbi:MAG: hypothetical protein UY75_C0018G0001, partial [Parcubacteria group bacterium GW2011_GWC2_52_8c]
FSELENKIIETKSPDWISWDTKTKELSVKDSSFIEKSDLLFDLGQVIEYYQR